MSDKTSVDKIPALIKFLEKKEKAAPSSIAHNIGSDIRTTNRILTNLSEIGVTQSTSFNTGAKIYSSVSLTKGYKKAYKQFMG